MTHNLLTQLEEEAKQVAAVTVRSAPQLVSLLRAALDLYARAMNDPHREASDDAGTVEMSLTSQNFNSLKASWDLACAGSYNQSLALLRPVMENWLAIQYITIRPGEACLWLQGKGRPKPPSVKQMTRALDPDLNDLNSKVGQAYGAFCRFSHTDSLAVLPTLSNDGTGIHYGVTYKEHLFRSYAYSIALWTGLMLARIRDSMGEHADWKTEHDRVQDEVLTFMESENRTTTDE